MNGLTTNRSDFERRIATLPPRDTFALSIERAADEGGGQRKIRGIANSFGVMRSSRIMHPAGAIAFLRRNGGRTLPLLAQHGSVQEFATIGTVTKMAVDPKAGLRFEATLADGVPLSDQAWELVRQGHLRTLSIGWTAQQSRYVTDQDVDLDPYLKDKMAEAGVREALAFLAYDLVEISMVDVPDDPNATLTARGGNTEIAAMNARFDHIERSLAELREWMDSSRDEFLDSVRADAVDVLVDLGIDPKAEYGRALLDCDTDVGQGECRTHGAGIGDVRRELDNWGKTTT